MVGAAVGAVMAAILGMAAPDWMLLVLCAVLIPISIFLFRRHSAFALLPLVLFLVLIRTVLLPERLPEIGFVTNLRNSLKQNAEALFLDRAGEAKGILLGDRYTIAADALEDYRSTGLLHLFAVSGLHVTLLVGGFERLVRTGKRWLNFTIVVLFMLFLCTVTGFSASVLRAAWMLLAARLTRLGDRQVDRPSVYCFAMALTLLFDPTSLTSAGFLLSYAAAAGILLLGKQLRRPFKKRFPASRIVTALTAATSAAIGMAPVQAYLFGELAWISIPLSILLIPTVPIILLCGFPAVLLYGLFPHVASALATPAYGALQFLTLITQTVDVPMLRLPAPHPVAIVLWYLGMLFCSPLFLDNRHRPPWIGLALFAASILLWFLL